MEILGIDVGGSGIKGAIIDTDSGSLVSPRFRLRTPQPATVGAVIEAVVAIVEHFTWQGLLGCGFPAAVKDGIALTASNIAAEWLGHDVRQSIAGATGCQVRVVNDADAAGLAEMRFGAGRGENGVVLIVTLGTGIGTALFVGGRLVPNLELGHIEVNGKEAEFFAAAVTRSRDGISWSKWGRRVGRYLQKMEQLLWPDLIIVGGGVSRHHERFFPSIQTRARLVAAEGRNDSGMIGAALAAEMG